MQCDRYFNEVGDYKHYNSCTMDDLASIWEFRIEIQDEPFEEEGMLDMSEETLSKLGL